MNHDDVIETANSYREYSQRISNAHYEMAETSKSRNKWLGIPATATAAIVGTTIFAALSGKNEPFWLQFSSGLLAITAAVLSALQTFMNYSEAEAKHRSAGAEFESAQHFLDIFLLRHAEIYDENQRATAIPELQAIGQKFDNASKNSPTIPDNVYYRVNAGRIKHGDHLDPKKNGRSLSDF